MSCLSTRAKQHTCAVHIDKPNGFLRVKAENVLQRLRQVRSTNVDSRSIIVDVRDARGFQGGHILTAIPLNCQTKTMARRAIVEWDTMFGDQSSCSAPSIDDDSKSTQVPRVSGPSVTIYDQEGSCPFCEENSPVGFFINSLLIRGNDVYFMEGGFEAFQRLHSADFIVRCSLVDTLSTPDGLSRSESVTSSITLSSHSRIQSVATSRVTIHSDPSERTFPIRSFVQPLQTACPKATKSHRLFLGHCVHANRSTVTKVGKCPNSNVDGADDILDTRVSKILPYLFIGNARDAQDRTLLRHLGITHIVNVSNSVPMPFQGTAEFKYLRLPASDTNQQNLRPAFDSAIAFINKARESNGIILVHCHAGISRSVAVVMAYLMFVWRHFNVVRALDFIHSRRPVAEPNLHFMGQLQRFYDELHQQPNPSQTDIGSSNPLPDPSACSPNLY
ncbi:Dual specificity protein phosphatase 10 [Paragonimus heterotremus]|uniref:protein-tyrosine-phosphatase n=1 Tax=Paragonimus heterotremus TaxID=100268 RepID=A0A8J4THI8_9TREM|nr:Dual specificity protein phosphatase 10 [Paragonimus heterotremus]